MGHLTKAIIVATLAVVFIATLAAADTTINTPIGPLFTGATYFITWTYTGSSSATGILNIHNTADNNVTVIDGNVLLSNKNESWVINVVPGTYYLGLNDGTGEKQSGDFQIVSHGGSGGTTSGSSPTASGSSNSTTPTAEQTTSTTNNTPDNTGTTGTGPTGTTGTGPTTGGTTTTPTTKSGASTLRSSLLGLFVGLSVVALVMIQLF